MNVDYSGDLTKDIKLLKKTTKKRQKIWTKIDLAYLISLLLYLGYVLAKCSNGLENFASFNAFLQTLIISRNVIYIRNISIKNKALKARDRIHRLINKLISTENYYGMLTTEDFEKAIVIKSKDHEKKYDDDNCEYNYIDTVINNIYLLNSEGAINVLKEIKKTITNSEKEEKEESTLEFLDEENLPQDLPVKQVLRLEK